MGDLPLRQASAAEDGGTGEEYMEPEPGAPVDSDEPELAPDEEDIRDSSNSNAERAAATCSEKIVGGCAARPGSWPSFIVLHPAQNSNFIMCGGTVIDRNWVLTAAHCVVQRDADGRISAPLRAKAAGEFKVREGLRRISKGKAVGGRVHDVAEIIIHGDYTENRNDVALIRLAGRLDAPRQQLASNGARDTLLAPGNIATVVGFGTTTFGGKSSTDLLQADVPIVTEEKCRTTYPDMTYSDRVCAGLDQGGKDSCQGDSGGPLFTRDALKQPVQVGVVSYGKGCGDPNAWGVYASVGNFENWIKQRVGNAVFSSNNSSTAGAPQDALQQIVGAASTTNPSELGDVTVEILPGNAVQIGQPLKVQVTSSIAGKLVVLNRDETGRTTQLFPNNFSSSTTAGIAREAIKVGETIVIPGDSDGFALRATPPAAKNTVIAIVVPANANVGDLTQAGKALKPIADSVGFISQLSERSDEADAERGVAVEASGSHTRAVGQRDYRIIE